MRIRVTNSFTRIAAYGFPAEACNSARKSLTGWFQLISPTDCANLSGSHSCAGQAKAAMGVDEWNYVTKGTCAKMGGKTAEEAKAAMALKK